MECPAGPRCGWLFPALFLWWAPCPESFYSSPRLSLPLFSDFRIPQCLYCAAHLPWLWWCVWMHHQALCGFSAHSSLSQNPFFPPFLYFCHSTALCSASHTTSLEWHQLLPVSRLGRVCSHSSCRQELFSRYRRGIDTTILWTSCVISAQKSSSSMCKVEDHCSSLGSAELWPTQAAALGAVCSPQWILSSSDQAWSCYLTQVEWVTDETRLLNVSSLGEGLSSL